MTAPTPEQLRALADTLDPVAEATLGRMMWHTVHDAKAALRAAADQLDAVQLQVTAAWDGGYAIGKAGGPSLNPFLTADTAPQEDRDE